MKGFLDRKEKTSEEVSRLMFGVPSIWEPINEPEDGRRAYGAEQCPRHNQEMFAFSKYIKV